MKQSDKRFHTIDRTKLWAVATPQAAEAELLKKAYADVVEKKLTVTDEAGAVEAAGKPVRIVEWSRPNIKITTAEDIPLAAAAIQIV